MRELSIELCKIKSTLTRHLFKLSISHVIVLDLGWIFQIIFAHFIHIAVIVYILNSFISCQGININFIHLASSSSKISYLGSIILR